MKQDKRKLRGENHHNWKGGRTKHTNGYILLCQPNHPRANCQGYIPERVCVMEKSIGSFLVPGEIPHHIDKDKTNNYIGNLLLFKTEAMHLAYHQRLIAFAECGHYDWRKCPFCHKYDAPKNLTTHHKRISKKPSFYHPYCERLYRLKRPAKRINPCRNFELCLNESNICKQFFLSTNSELLCLSQNRNSLYCPWKGDGLMKEGALEKK